MDELDRWVVIGGSGVVGSALAARLVTAGSHVTIVDRAAPPGWLRECCPWLELDVLVDDVVLPPGKVAVLAGGSNPSVAARWTLVLDNAVTAARLAPALRGRDVVLASSVEAYGAAPGPLHESTTPRLPLPIEQVHGWCELTIRLAAAGPCPPWRAAAVCRELTDGCGGGRWVYALSKLAQERMVETSGAGSVTVLRFANIFTSRQDRVVSQMARRALMGRPIDVTRATIRSFVALDDAVEAFRTPLPPGVYNVGGRTMALEDLAALVRDAAQSFSSLRVRPSPPEDSSGWVDSSLFLEAGGRFGDLQEGVRRLVEDVRNDGCRPFEPSLPVVVPARPVRPDEVAARQAEALWSGRLKAGQQWSAAAKERVAGMLATDAAGFHLACTTSGTVALRLALAATVGTARPGDVAVLPSYTFPATAEVLVQLGYCLRFSDVDEATWTLDPADVAIALEEGPVRVVVPVDTFGNPADYQRLCGVCERSGVVVVSDSAAGLGGAYHGRPIGTQAHAHAFSMSFAKSVMAGGAGGAVALAGGARLDPEAGWDRSALMSELHAIAALDQLAVVDELVARRRELRDAYLDALDGFEGVIPQVTTADSAPAWAHFVIRVTEGRRDEVARGLLALGIETKPYFPALHHTTHRTSAARRLPVTDVLHAEALALPMSSELTPRHAERVCAALGTVLRRRRSGSAPWTG